MPIPNEFIGISSVGTFTGALSVIFIICNTIKSTTEFIKNWLILLISVAISFLTLTQTREVSWIEFALCIVNGCLLYLSALGSNLMMNRQNIVIEEFENPDKYKSASLKATFFTNWFK